MIHDGEVSVDNMPAHGDVPTDEDMLADPPPAHGDVLTQGEAPTSKAQDQVDMPLNGSPSYGIQDESDGGFG
jgi:hypothetical protein